MTTRRALDRLCVLFQRSNHMFGRIDANQAIAEDPSVNLLLHIHDFSRIGKDSWGNKVDIDNEQSPLQTGALASARSNSGHYHE